MNQLWTKRVFSFILSALFAAGMFALPETGKAGHLAAITDNSSTRLVGYWDLRDRETFFQVTNITGADVNIHIQIYDVSTGCAEFDYFDTLTPRDTHVYDVSSLDRNNGVALSPPDLSGGHGIIAITQTDGTGSTLDDDALTGNFSIFDSAGFEYRTNFAGDSDNTDSDDDFTINFNNVDGSVFTDLVVIGYDTTDGGIDPDTGTANIELFDADENPISCPDIVLGCEFDSDGLGNVINVGINQAVTNSRGGPSLCLGTDTVGYIEVDSVEGDRQAVFIGLNNGNSTGSMDSGLHD